MHPIHPKKTSNGHEVYTCNINLKHPKPELSKVWDADILILSLMSWE